MKIKVILAFFVFSLGLFYLSLIHFATPHYGQSAPFELIYGITGNNDTTIDLLKCLDKKSIIFAAHNEKSPLTESKRLTKECLEEWLYQEAEKSGFYSAHH